MRLERFSLKQMKLLSWWCENSPYSGCDAIICDGAVRSGKTLCMSLSFVLWAFYRYNGYSFAICGKTIKNVRRNIIVPLIPLLKEIGFVRNRGCRKICLWFLSAAELIDFIFTAARMKEAQLSFRE